MINQIYPPEQRLNKANASNTEAPFCVYMYLFLMTLFQQTFMTSSMILTQCIFLFWLVMFPVVPLMGFTFHNLLGLLECADL